MLVSIQANIFKFMTTSERIQLIKEIARKLDSEEWSVIDLTFNLFGFSTQEIFSGSKFEYVLQHIQSGNDESLFDLAKHLKIDAHTSHTDISPSFWRNGYFNLFISHLASDKQTAQNLKDALGSFSISGFVAHSDIEPTKEWQDEIELALRTSDALVALMIQNFHESKWTDQEIGLALGRDLLIIPVRMGQDPYGFIAKFQAIGYTSIDALASNIFESLLKNKKTSRKMSNAIMYQFENSGSFASAKNNMELVEKIKYWDKNLIDRLNNAKENNSQIENSYGVSSRIHNITYKFENPK